MKNAKQLLSLTFTFIVLFVHGQSEIKSSVEQKPKKAVQVPFEKIYLHLDRFYYSTGDDIWFKAYLADAKTNKLSDKSNNLYVELISPDTKILKRLVIRIDKGLGNGDIHLDDSIPSGKYQIRAYTNWMRNFGETFFFKKEILVENHIEIKDTSISSIGGKEKIDVQFFPEGGTLIENVPSLVAFKAINMVGLGCNVKGKIISSAGDTINTFESTHLGMGNFSFIPKKGLTYTALYKSDNGNVFSVDLPPASKSGYSLSISEKDSFINIVINTNQKTLDEISTHEFIIAASTHGKLHYLAKTKIVALMNSAYVPRKEFPEGIARITLMDTLLKPYCERLYYNNQPPPLHVTVVPDRKTYKPRQMVNLQISIRDAVNNPVLANLSLSAVDGNQVKETENESDINSYFLLESELRGHIEHPSYYFDTTKTDRQKALDNLLLTQGWRDFVWKYLSDSSITLKYKIEKGITISGKLRRLLLNKPLIDANISLILFGKGKSFFNLSTTDSSGRYTFDGLNFSGQQTLIVSATNKNHRSQGWISLDSLFAIPSPLNYSWTYKPKLYAKEEAYFKQEADKRYNIIKNYHLTDTIALREVIVNAKKPKKYENDGNFRIYGWPDYSLTVTDEMQSYSNIIDLLLGRVAGVSITSDNSISIRGGGTPLFVLDGITVNNIDDILSLPIQEVDKIEIIKSGFAFGSQGGNGVISVFTKHGFVAPPKPIFYSINQKVTGYYQMRTFYTPKYNVKLPEYEKPDLRTTIHWEPNIVTDANGNANVSYFNADANSTIKISVQGISQFGIPINCKVNYEVKQPQPIGR